MDLPDEDPEAAEAARVLIARFGRSFQPGEVIYREGEPGTEAYLLEEGRVRLIKKVRGAERSLMVLKPGDLFGESALVPGAERSSTAVALSSGLALAIDQTTLQNLLEHNASIASRMVKQLVRRLRDAEDQIELIMLTDVQSKIVSALLKLAQQTREAGGNNAVFTVTPMELATRVGLDVDTVKRSVQKLREGQYIRVADERLEVPDIEGLRKLYGLLGQKDEVANEA
ncbi:Crp/Fnr family transcriptional regulator [Polyangium jinanense]|uniref:Crp/Fnr family transcriptional regulator n=1 Tax=Polyangium jinanense TaxID=2829994 RepID=A0A9X3XHS7_9BACT|nr:Crp/Fnr family transcriptional regulator [Polyangium jinanense]MDC3959382.1 Crp/Fnr family transcriptional regulator [Polyangium jinanense]MDC3988406.1 Crp/Fnr family transcriptional regulator [Polyangium jinanense]